MAAAQRLLGMPGRISHVDLILADAESPLSVERLLPPGARVVRASEQADTVAQLTAAFELNLVALSLLALVVGMFLVYNTVLFSVVQRRAVFGTLRTLGTTPGQLFRLILAETLLTAALGAALGVGLGYLLGQSAVRLVTRTINDLYYVVSVSGAPLTLATVVKGVAMGLGAPSSPPWPRPWKRRASSRSRPCARVHSRRVPDAWCRGSRPAAWRWLCSARRASRSPRARCPRASPACSGSCSGSRSWRRRSPWG